MKEHSTERSTENIIGSKRWNSLYEQQKNTNSKVAIIGTGFVGASIAYALTIRNLSHEIVLIDEQREKAVGEALDIQHGIPYIGISNVYGLS